MWYVVGIVFVTMLLIQLGLFAWIEYLLLRIDELEASAGSTETNTHRTPTGRETEIFPGADAYVDHLAPRVG